MTFYVVPGHFDGCFYEEKKKCLEHVQNERQFRAVNRLSGARERTILGRVSRNFFIRRS